MQWPWRRRPKQPVARHALPRQAATWAEPAFPPAPVAAAPAQAAAPVAVPAQSSAVLLGFSDGSEVALDERDPSALALRAVADLLVQDRPE
jgi:hypothetical protein